MQFGKKVNVGRGSRLFFEPTNETLFRDAEGNGAFRTPK